MRYCPVPSVTAVRVRSMSAGLDASTVTPGNTAPEASLTVPASDACADAIDGSRATHRIARTDRTTMRMGLLCWKLRNALYNCITANSQLPIQSANCEKSSQPPIGSWELEVGS